MITTVTITMIMNMKLIIMFRDRYLCQIQLIHTGRVAQVDNLRDVKEEEDVIMM